VGLAEDAPVLRVFEGLRAGSGGAGPSGRGSAGAGEGRRGDRAAQAASVRSFRLETVEPDTALPPVHLLPVRGGYCFVNSSSPCNCVSVSFVGVCEGASPNCMWIFVCLCVWVCVCVCVRVCMCVCEGASVWVWDSLFFSPSSSINRPASHRVDVSDSRRFTTRMAYNQFPQPHSVFL
jgi:hypothetical protein